jgi:hypothetical protein
MLSQPNRRLGTHRSLKLKEKRGQKRVKSLCSQLLGNKESKELRHKLSQEEIDDLPVIIYWLKQMKVASVIDEHLATPHGNRQGLSYGELAVLLLTYIVSEGDHRICRLEKWVSEHQRNLRRNNRMVNPRKRSNR